MRWNHGRELNFFFCFNGDLCVYNTCCMTKAEEGEACVWEMAAITYPSTSIRTEYDSSWMRV